MTALSQQDLRAQTIETLLALPAAGWPVQQAGLRAHLAHPALRGAELVARPDPRGQSKGGPRYILRGGCPATGPRLIDLLEGAPVLGRPLAAAAVEDLHDLLGPRG